ncbi:MAG TPA: alpha-L-rhamnosidase C-terminal domain-containing protein, partial [Verrucomicrobiota bacterium]|nr:alpha-L-rhamnosidase C-terminal domain-containing protein [Verrucomicrobiota bacterium]
TLVRTPRGPVASRWRNDNGSFRLEVEVPHGVKATAILPSGARQKLHGGKQTLQEPLPGP